MSGKISQYPNTATSFASGDLFDVSKLISPGTYQSQKFDWDILKALILSENIGFITVSEAQAKVLASTLISLKTYIIDAASGGDRVLKVMAANGVTNQFYQTAIDLTTGEIGTYDITVDVFTIAIQPYSTLPTAPTAAEDNTKGYKVGYTVRAVDTSVEYICKDNTTGAAVWDIQIRIIQFKIELSSAEILTGGMYQIPNLNGVNGYAWEILSASARITDVSSAYDDGEILIINQSDISPQYRDSGRVIKYPTNTFQLMDRYSLDNVSLEGDSKMFVKIIPPTTGDGIITVYGTARLIQL